MVAAQRGALLDRTNVFKSKSSTVTLGDVLGETHVRFEAVAFGLERRKAVAAVQAYELGAMQLGDPRWSLSVSTPNRMKRVFVDATHGIPFLSSSDIIDVRPDLGTFISKKLTKHPEKLLVKPYDLLVSRSGTVGNIAMAGRRIAGCALSEHALRVSFNKSFEAGFVAAMLRGKFGRPQLTQAAYGSVVVHIEPNHLREVWMPAVPQLKRERIGNAMCEAVDLRDKANTLLDDADAELRSALKLPPLQSLGVKRDRTVTKLSSLRERFDAQFHDPLVIEAERLVRGLPMDVRRIGDEKVGKVFAVTRFRKRTYSEVGIPLYSSKQVFQIDPLEVKRLAKGAHTKDLNEIQLTEGMIVVSCSGTIGRVILATKYMSDWTVSQHALRVVAAPSFDPGYLYVWLASDYGQLLMRRFSYGSVIVHIDREMLGDVPIPIPGNGLVKRIGALANKANRHRQEAWNLERKAIQEVEELLS